MPNEFYKGPRQEQIGQSLGALRGPDTSEAVKGNNRRAKSLTDSLDSLVYAGSKAIDLYSDKKTKEATQKGRSDAHQGRSTTDGYGFWSGDAQQEAYDDVRAENSVKEFPQYAEQHMTNNKEIKKPLDEMTREERQGYLAQAREAFFKERGITDSPFRGRADAYADELTSKQLDYMDKKSVQLREAKTQNTISDLVSKGVNAFSGSPAEIDAVIDADLGKYQQAMGDPYGDKTKNSIMTGLLKSVMQDDPNLGTLDYLKSEEARQRFGHLEGFDQAVEQANNFSLKAQNSQRVKLKSAAENDFYGLLNVGGFKTIEDVQNKLNEYDDNVLDQGDKFSLMNKAARHLKLSAAADSLQGAIASKNFGVVNAAKQEELLTSFERNVMPKAADIDAVLGADAGPNDPETHSQNAFSKWVLDGFNVPTHVKEHLNTPINAGNTQAWDRRLATYQRLSQRLGATGVSRLYSSETQASLDEFAALTADTVMKPEDRKQALTNFMEGAKQDRITGLSVNYTVRNEIMNEDKGIMKEIQQFASEGGGDTTVDFGVPADLQPFTTMRSNSDTSIDGYAVKSIAGNYSVYRRQNMTANPDVALRKAKNDFLNQNLWVDWAEKSTYVPREYGENFNVRGMQYIKDSGIVTRLSISEGLPPEQIEKKVTIEPSTDYHSSRKMSIFYDGIEQDEKFTFEQFDRRMGVLDAQSRRTIEREDADRRNSKEYKERQEKIMKFQKSIRTFGFGMN